MKLLPFYLPIYLGRRNERNASIINLFLIGSATSMMINAIIDIPMLSPPSGPFCSIQSRFKDVSFGAAIFCVYFVLWFRIFIVFYRDKIMMQDLSKIVQYINISAMPLLFVTGTSIVIRFLSLPGYEYAGCGCKTAYTREIFIINWIAVVVCTTVFQTVFLFCFVYPLYLHRRKMLSSGCNKLSILPIVKRAAIAAGVCITSDLLNLVFALAYMGPTDSISHPFQTYLSHFIYILNLLVNLIATILSFANWRDKLFPFGKEFGNKPVRQITSRAENSSSRKGGKATHIMSSNGNTEQMSTTASKPLSK